MDEISAIDAIKSKSLVFTVTSGRSGTKLLATLLRDCLGIEAEHEPAPRVNYVLRSIINAPEDAKYWLLYEKLPAILAQLKGPVYAETSHLFCKGFIEPMLELGLRPKFIVLTRPATEVAQSLYKLNVVPERTSAGRLVLLGPRDPGVLPLPNWERYSDYQLCYWYAREIERRQRVYSTLFRTEGLASLKIEMQSLTDWASFTNLSHFVVGELNYTPDRGAFSRVTETNQNPRAAVSGGAGDRPVPDDMEQQALAIDEAISRDIC